MDINVVTPFPNNKPPEIMVGCSEPVRFFLGPFNSCEWNTILTGWCFGTWLLCSINHTYGVSSETRRRSPSFFKMVKATHSRTGRASIAAWIPHSSMANNPLIHWKPFCHVEIILNHIYIHMEQLHNIYIYYIIIHMYTLYIVCIYI
jgi:hypothetical protein